MHDEKQPEGMEPPMMLKAPFPWFGGKTRAAPLIWERLGKVDNYVEPFAGSLAVLLNRPHPPGLETVNDLDGLLCNVWRAIAWNPQETARYVDWPSNECDLHARHVWLRAQRGDLTARLMGDPTYYDAQIAGWWLWGIAQWIGSGWCSEQGTGAWGITEDAAGVRRFGRLDTAATRGVARQRLHLWHGGQGVARKRLHLWHGGQGVARKRLHEGASRTENLLTYFAALQSRLARVRVCCGDWRRVLGPNVTVLNGLTGVVLDPPYAAEEDRVMGLYATDSGTVAHEVRQWCVENGTDPRLRIVLCGYDEIHDALLAHGWTKAAWRAHGGMGNQGEGRGRRNRDREQLWFSPQCLQATQLSLFHT